MCCVDEGRELMDRHHGMLMARSLFVRLWRQPHMHKTTTCSTLSVTCKRLYSPRIYTLPVYLGRRQVKP